MVLRWNLNHDIKIFMILYKCCLEMPPKLICMICRYLLHDVECRWD